MNKDNGPIFSEEPLAFYIVKISKRGSSATDRENSSSIYLQKEV